MLSDSKYASGSPKICNGIDNFSFAGVSPKSRLPLREFMEEDQKGSQGQNWLEDLASVLVGLMWHEYIVGGLMNAGAEKLTPRFVLDM